MAHHSESRSQLGRFRWWRDVSIIAMTFAAFLAALVVFWSTREAIINLDDYQASLMENEGRSVSEEISRFVSERIRLLHLFAEQNAGLLYAYMSTGEDGVLHDEVESLIKRHFPNYFAFTIRTGASQLIPDDLGEFVGEVCRMDIEQFWQNHDQQLKDEVSRYRPFIHPQGGNYHFDMMTYWETPVGDGAVLFVSFHPVKIAEIISSFELPGHEVVLVRNDQQDLIEVTAQGARDVLGEHNRLSPQEQGRVVHSLPVEHTRWTVKVMPKAGFMEAQTWTVYRRAGIQVLGIVLFWLGAMWLMIRALKQKEQAYATLEEQTERLLNSQEVAHVGSWDWNILTGALEWTDEIYSIFGRSRDDFGATYENFLECVHPDDRDTVTAAVGEAVKNDVPYDLEHRVVLPDGKIGYVHERGKVYRDENGRAIRMLGIVHDITERTMLDRSKAEFIAMVSHELRTPLTSIKGSLGLLAAGTAGALPEKAQGMVDLAHRNVDRLIELVSDILDLEKLESGKMDFHFQALNLSDVVVEGVQSTAGLAEKNAVTLRVASKLPELPIYGDKTRIIQVLTNLLSNAVKFSESGGVVDVSALTENGMAAVYVSDQGPGIPEDFKEKIFDKFTQVDASDKRAKSGTGLGLSICKSIVEEHGGTIRVESVFGHGSTFIFTVPLAH